MTDNTIRDKVAEAIYHAHRPYKQLSVDEHAFIYRQSADAAIAAYVEALTDTRWMLVELPEMRNGWWPVLIGEPANVYIQSTRREPIRVSGLASFTPDEARKLAAALLAAARAAESGSTTPENKE